MAKKPGSSSQADGNGSSGNTTQPETSSKGESSPGSPAALWQINFLEHRSPSPDQDHVMRDNPHSNCRLCEWVHSGAMCTKLPTCPTRLT